MIEQCKKCLEEIESFKIKYHDHEKRISLLEDFENRAIPILEAVKTIKNDNRWMIIIFISFVSICTYVYQTDIKNFMTIQSNDKVNLIKELNIFKLEMKDKINDLNNQIITSTKTNYKDTTREMKEISKEKKD